MLRCYYDIAMQDKFDELFDGLWIKDYLRNQIDFRKCKSNGTRGGLGLQLYRKPQCDGDGARHRGSPYSDADEVI